MNPIALPADPCGALISTLDKFRGILGLYKVLVPGIAVTEVIAQFDICRNAITKPHETFDNHLLSIFVRSGRRPLQNAKLDRYIPLNRKLMVWDSCRDLVKPDKHRRLIRGLNRSLVSGHDKCNNRSQRCREAHLETSTGRNQPCSLQLQEHSIRRFGRISIAKLLKCNLARRQRRTQLEVRQWCIVSGIRRYPFQIRIAPDEAGLPTNPVDPLTCLAIGNAPQTPT